MVSRSEGEGDNEPRCRDRPTPYVLIFPTQMREDDYHREVAPLWRCYPDSGCGSGRRLTAMRLRLP